VQLFVTVKLLALSTLLESNWELKTIRIEPWRGMTLSETSFAVSEKAGAVDGSLSHAPLSSIAAPAAMYAQHRREGRHIPEIPRWFE
jgi:hypothetical protein